MEQRLIVTADDFGACHYIDNGIREAIKAGVVSSVAAMVNFSPRDASHPHGEYPGSINAIKSLIKDIQTHPDYAKRRNVRVGLHFNFHAGFPAYPNRKEVKSLLSKKHKVQGKAVFRTIEEFNPAMIKTEVVAKELRAQYSLFHAGLGYVPDHFSSHFPLIFMTPRFFDVVCEIASPLNIPIRNPFVVWQTKNKEKDKTNRATLKEIKSFFKQRSKTRKLKFKRALKLIKTVNDTLLERWKQRNFAALTKHEILFADNVNVHMYGNGDKVDCVDNVLTRRLPFHPAWYKKDKGMPIVTEMITHVGHGDYDPMQIPRGIDENYFSGRSNELKSILKNSELKTAKLFNYKYAFRYKERGT